MKKTLLIAAGLLMLVVAFTPNVKAQEMSTGLDIYSSYVWRGTKFGSGPAFQPSLEFSAGGFTLGAWGSFNASTDEAAESDLYAGYGFELGEGSSLSFTVTDYYFPGSAWADGTSHSIEPLVTLALGNLSLTGAYMTGLKDNGINDYYFELGYTAGQVNLTLGAGDGQYSAMAVDQTKAGDFAVCNIGIGTSKEVKITDSFSLPVSGSVILNPSSEQLYVVVGISL